MDWMRRRAESITDKLVTNVLTAGVIAVGLAVWKFLTSGFGPDTVVLFLVTIAAVMVTLGETRRFLLAQRRARQLTNEQLEQQIRGWLYRDKFSIKNDPRDDAFFQFSATDEVGRTVTISRPRGHPVFLLVAVHLTLSPEDREIIGAMPTEEQDLFHADLRIELQRSGFGFLLTGRPMETIQVIDSVPCDETLTEAALLLSVLRIRKALDLVREIASRRMRPYAALASQSAVPLPTPPGPTQTPGRPPTRAWTG